MIAAVTGFDGELGSFDHLMETEDENEEER